MVKAVGQFIAAGLLAVSCGYGYSWENFVVDGHRTGVTAPTASNVDEALGVIRDGVYTAPNGNVFSACATYAVASDMIGAQPRMADLKAPVGYAPKAMSKHRPESELSNWFVDRIMEDTERLTGRHVDVGIANFGGIRGSIPQGVILKDDIVSMFPFRNCLCHVTLKGEDLQAIFDRFAEKSPQVLGGVKFVVTDHKIDTLLIGGKPLDPEKLYGVATIDFLLDGGDGLHIARNARDLVITDVYVMDSMLPYVKELAAAGKPIEYHTDGRVVTK